MGFWDYTAPGIGTPSGRLDKPTCYQAQRAGGDLDPHPSSQKAADLPSPKYPLDSFPGFLGLIDGDWKLHRIQGKGRKGDFGNSTTWPTTPQKPRTSSTARRIECDAQTQLNTAHFRHQPQRRHSNSRPVRVTRVSGYRTCGNAQPSSPLRRDEPNRKPGLSQCQRHRGGSDGRMHLLAGESVTPKHVTVDDGSSRRSDMATLSGFAVTGQTCYGFPPARLTLEHHRQKVSTDAAFGLPDSTDLSVPA